MLGHKSLGTHREQILGFYKDLSGAFLAKFQKDLGQIVDLKDEE